MLYWFNHTTFAGNSMTAWLVALAGAALGFILIAGTLRVLTARLQTLQLRSAKPVQATLVALLQGTRRWLVLLLALVIAGGFLQSTPRVGGLLAHAAFALCALQVALWANALIRYWVHRKQDAAVDGVINPVFLNMLTWAAQLLVWATLLLALFANIGVNITAFVASLGVGGIAVALALQSILGDLFSSVAIGLDKPFVIGDVIAFGDQTGTVTQVGVKSTRVASLSGEQLVISNSNLLKELIHNNSRMQERRVVFGFRLPYTTGRDDVESIVARVRGAIQAQSQTRFGRGHLTGFGEYGLDVEFVYHVLSPDFSVYRDIQQQVNFRIMDLLAELGVAFAVPVREIVPHAHRATESSPA
jgi:small-conductance mechanosensitive channel